MSFLGLEKIIDVFSNRVTTVSNSKKQEKINSLYDEILKSISELAGKVEQINKFKKELEESPVTPAPNDTSSEKNAAVATSTREPVSKPDEQEIPGYENDRESITPEYDDNDDNDDNDSKDDTELSPKKNEFNIGPVLNSDAPSIKQIPKIPTLTGLPQSTKLPESLQPVSQFPPSPAPYYTKIGGRKKGVQKQKTKSTKRKRANRRTKKNMSSLQQGQAQQQAQQQAQGQAQGQAQQQAQQQAQGQAQGQAQQQAQGQAQQQAQGQAQQQAQE